MSEPAARRIGTALAVATVVVGRWLALLATAYFSLFHWMRSEYLEFSHVWQYGLPLLDPRVTAALLWWGLHSLFLGLVLVPLARWLADRLPEQGAVRWAAWGALALGLGTRGIAGPIVMRAAVAQPVALLPGGGELTGGMLIDTALARGVIALTEAWWLLAALVVVLRAARGTAAAAWLKGWRAALVLVLYALVQSPEAAYFLTAGGPRGATMSLPLLAYQLGFGAQEFGYASVLTMLMGGIVLLGTLFVLAGPGSSAAGEDASTGPSAGTVWLWWGAPLLVLAPLVVAVYRNPAEPVGESRLPVWLGVSLLTATGAAGWTCLLLAPLSRILEDSSRFRRAGLLGPMLLPSLVWILPSVRVFGEQKGWIDAVIPCAGLVFGAPYLYLGLGMLNLGRMRSVIPSRALGVAALAVAWATWTDVLNPLMLTQTGGGAQLLPTGMVWKLSTHLWTSPLSAPGWGAAWIGASALALAATVLLLCNRDERPNPPQQADPSRL